MWWPICLSSRGPMLNPATHKPLTAEDLFPLFSEEAARQELNDTDRWIGIPDEVREMYRIWRPTPLVRAMGLEKALDTPATYILRTRA